MPPGRFLSDAEIERLEGWPEGIERRELLRYFDLDGEDLGFVRTQRGAPNQLGIALQLGALRWLGFIPENLQEAPADALDALAGALDVQPRVIFEYAVRAPTRVEHRLLVRAHAGFRAFSDRDGTSLGPRLVQIALEHERPSLLLARICELLRVERIERPSIDRLVRLVGWTRERAHEHTLSGLLRSSPARCIRSWTSCWQPMAASPGMVGCVRGQRASAPGRCATSLRSACS